MGAGHVVANKLTDTAVFFPFEFPPPIPFSGIIPPSSIYHLSIYLSICVHIVLMRA